MQVISIRNGELIKVGLNLPSKYVLRKASQSTGFSFRKRNPLKIESRVHRRSAPVPRNLTVGMFLSVIMPPPFVDKPEQDAGNQVFPNVANLSEDGIERQCQPDEYKSADN